MISALADLTIYSNVSLKDGRAGFGYVAIHGGRLLLGAGVAGFGLGNSFQAEVDAAEAAMLQAIGRVGRGIKAVDLVISNSRVEEMFLKQRLWVSSPAGPGCQLRVCNVEPYTRKSNGAAYANAVAHNLAVLGRDGEIVRQDFELDRNWRLTLTAFDHRLDPDPRPVCLSGKEAAAALGVAYHVVSDMVRDGRLAVDSRSGKVLENSIIALRRREVEPEPRLSIGVR